MKVFLGHGQPMVLAIALGLSPFLAAAQTTSSPIGISGGPYRIAGTVVSKTDGRPLSHVRVFIRDAKNQQKLQSVVTADDGRFEFAGVPAGKFALSGRKRGFIPAGYEQHDQFSTAIVTGAGVETENLNLRLAPVAVIRGKVLDEAGDPIRHATVTSYYNDHSLGVDHIRQFRISQTDDLGVYEMTPLLPGTYYLSVSAKPWYAIHPTSERVAGVGQDQTEAPPVDRSFDVAYPLTYYPDVTDAESATPIPVRGGERLDVDFHLTPVPSLHLLFRVSGDQKTGYTFPQLEQPAFEGSSFVQAEGSRMISPGVFELTGIPAGRYNIHVNGGAQPRLLNDVDLAKDGEEVDTSAAESLSTVRVSVRVSGEASLPAQLSVGFRSGHTAFDNAQMLDSKGEAEFQQVAPGRHEVFVFGGTKRYFISHMSAEGAEVSGRTMTVAAGSSPKVALTLVTGSTEVQGTVTRGGKPFAGAMVVIVPRSAGMDHDLFRRDQSDLDGTFSLYGVIPGSYTILAIENGWDLDWSQPGVIAAYLKRGMPIQVSEQGGRPMKVVDAIEVQPK